MLLILRLPAAHASSFLTASALLRLAAAACLTLFPTLCASRTLLHTLHFALRLCYAPLPPLPYALPAPHTPACALCLPRLLPCCLLRTRCRRRRASGITPVSSRRASLPALAPRGTLHARTRCACVRSCAALSTARAPFSPGTIPAKLLLPALRTCTHAQFSTWHLPLQHLCHSLLSPRLTRYLRTAQHNAAFLLPFIKQSAARAPPAEQFTRFCRASHARVRYRTFMRYTPFPHTTYTTHRAARRTRTHKTCFTHHSSRSHITLSRRRKENILPQVTIAAHAFSLRHALRASRSRAFLRTPAHAFLTTHYHAKALPTS